MRRWGLLAAFIIAVVGTGMLIGLNVQPGQWYAALNKPFFTPPNSVFGPAWTVLYIIIAIVGWRIWIAPERAGLRGLWLGQMALNFLWTPIFFGAHLILPGLIVLLGVWLCTLLFIMRAWRTDRVSAVMFIPYLAWLTYASALNAGILALN